MTVVRMAQGHGQVHARRYATSRLRLSGDMYRVLQVNTVSRGQVMVVKKHKRARTRLPPSRLKGKLQRYLTRIAATTFGALVRSASG
jgi:hypothetical protein